jgi:hypothetical protein
MNPAFMLGGALGLAVLVAVSDGRRGALLAAGADQVGALNGGLHAGSSPAPLQHSRPP